MHRQHYDGYSSLPLPSAPAPAPPPPAYVPDPPAVLPKVGQTRCYWALLASDLQFIYLDPVLASHLKEQASALCGKSLLDFVHPDEQASAKHDLGTVLDSRKLHGSITRVRYSRLSRVRRLLGYDGPATSWTDGDKIALDSNYMAVDIVINWAADGLVLCFIHAIVDLDPLDNDEHNKTGWTNWCGTPLMTPDQIELLYRRLLVCIPQTGSVSRVFQILSNQHDRQLLLSWPPDQGQGQGPDGRHFAKLVEDVQIGTGQNVNNAKTSCTRRYKALQNMPLGVGGEVESIFIPHGTIIFACHKVNSSPRSAPNTGPTMQQMSYSYPPPHSQPYYDQGNPYALPPLSSTPAYNYMPPQQPASYSPQHWSQGNPPPSSSYNHWGPSTSAHPPSPPPASVSNLRSGSYPPPAPPPQGHQWPAQPPPPPYMEPGTQMSPAFNRSMSPNYAYSTGGGSEGNSSAGDIVPPPRRRVSPGSTRDQYGPGGRSAGNRPMGVLRCSSCKATQSPEWRKGPSGKKELCNACGLRYARSRAKKEGHNLAQRRRKDKGMMKRDSATPPTPSSSYSALRRTYDEASFMSTSSAGSASGSDIYSHSGHHALDEMTPSPSPPASGNLSFVHYSPQTDGRAPYSAPTGSFYSVPSPLSNPPVHPGAHPHPGYAGRLSPMLPSASPVSQSPLAANPPASFERERERERDLPPTPVSAEPRHTTRRSILQQ